MTSRAPARQPAGPPRWVRLSITLSVLAALVVAAVWVYRSGAMPGIFGIGGPECTVETDSGDIGLDRDQAKRATTSVAVGGSDADLSDIDPAVIDRLAAGPPDDAGPSLTCQGTGDGSGLAIEELTATGLTPRAQAVRDAMAEVFGEQSLGGFAPGGVQRPEASTHNEGRAIDVFYRPVSEENRRQGWVLAQWLVAHADELDIQYVIFDDQFWYSDGRSGQWRDYQAPPPANEILRHLDHVHVDVWRGG